MKQLLCVLVALGLAASVASAGPNAGGVLWVHDTGQTFTTDTVTWPADPAAVGCPGSVDNEMPLYGVGSTPVSRYWKVYAAFPPGSSPRLKSVAWGTQFPVAGTSTTSYVSVTNGDRPNGETSSTMFFIGGDGFPTVSGGTIGQSFPNQGTTSTGARTGLVTALFTFWGWAYTDGVAAPPTWSLVPKVGDDNFGDDMTPANTDRITGYGTLGFGIAGTTPCPALDPNALAACCDLAGTLCDLTTQANCAAPNEWHSTFYVCDPNPCPVPTGACCLPDGRCFATPCEPPAPSPLCPYTTAAACGEVDGTYMGDGVPCDPSPCSPVGACCFPDGTCHLYVQVDCTGNWAPAGSCEPVNICPAPDELRACCDAQRLCTLTLQANCALPSQWRVEWSTCEPSNPCLALQGACCAQDGACELTTVGACASPATWRGDLMSCNPNACPLLPTEPTSWGQIKNRYH